jgi:hypothetical protein
MTAAADTQAHEGADSRVAPVPMSGDMVHAFGLMIEAIPESTGDGMENILRQLAGAQSAADLDSPWSTEGILSLVDRRIRIVSARRMPSDYTEGLGWYLVLDTQDLQTGELATVTCGSVSVVAQVAKAYQIGALPLSCIPREAKKPTKDGFRPIHLEILA